MKSGCGGASIDPESGEKKKKRRLAQEFALATPTKTLKNALEETGLLAAILNQHSACFYSLNAIKWCVFVFI